MSLDQVISVDGGGAGAEPMGDATDRCGRLLRLPSNRSEP
jgi:hypothetical protein